MAIVIFACDLGSRVNIVFIGTIVAYLTLKIKKMAGKEPVFPRQSTVILELPHFVIASKANLPDIQANKALQEGQSACRCEGFSPWQSIKDRHVDQISPRDNTFDADPLC